MVADIVTDPKSASISRGGVFDIVAPDGRGLWYFANTSLPISSAEEVYICWSGEAAIVLEWDVFIRIWDSLRYPFDSVCIFDDSNDWGLVMGQEELAAFFQRNQRFPVAGD